MQLPDIYSLTRLSYPKRGLQTNPGLIRMASLERKKCHKFWAFNKEAIEPISSQLEPLKVMVWGAVSTKGLIGPYFFHSNGSNITVDQYSYQNCIAWFVEELKGREMLNRAYFMQDGATPHTALSTRREKIIGKNFEYAWPPYSPDLTLADYWLWPTLKRVVYSGKQKPYTSITSWKRAITFASRK